MPPTCFTANHAAAMTAVIVFGVSLANVVATIDNQASHHGTARPDTKNSDVLLPARLAKNSAGEKQSNNVATTMIQSIGLRCMCQVRGVLLKCAHEFNT